jgi:hypothetical protein
MREIGELAPPDSFPMCAADIDEPCEPGCHAWLARAQVYYLSHEDGVRLLEQNRRLLLERELGALQAEADKVVPVVPEVPAVEEPVRKGVRRRKASK